MCIRDRSGAVPGDVSAVHGRFLRAMRRGCGDRRQGSAPVSYTHLDVYKRQSLFGVPSGLGCAPFVPASRHGSLSWQKRCARHFPNFSWVPQKAIPSRNSSPSGRTCKTCQFSAWLRKQKQGPGVGLSGVGGRLISARARHRFAQSQTCKRRECRPPSGHLLGRQVRRPL